jgi:peptide/nickel transport system permease protein
MRTESEKNKERPGKQVLEETPVAGGPVPAPSPAVTDNETRTETPVAADLGHLVAMPPQNADLGYAESREERALAGAAGRASGQLLTGRAATANLSLSPNQLAWRKLKKNRLAMIGGVLLIFLYAVTLLAPFIAPYGYASQGEAVPFHPPMPVYFNPGPTAYGTTKTYNEFREQIYVPDPKRPLPLRFLVKGERYQLLWLIPTDVHLFGTGTEQRVYLLGTDQFGRDYLSRLLYASQISLSVGLIGILITFTLGLLVGGMSGFYGGKIDDITMRLCEVLMSVPDFYLLLALAAMLPPTLPPAVVYVMIIGILSFVGWAGMARVIRGMVLSVREREYVEAARSLGVSDLKIIVRHVLPSTLTYSIVAATLSIPGYILGEAGLSFLGLGIRDPMPSWGNMLSAALNLSVLESKTWILAPGLMIFLTTLAFNFLGDGLRDALDPKSK